MTEVKLSRHSIKSLSKFHCVQVFALNVFDEGHLEEAIVGEILDDDWDCFERRELGSTPAALSGDEFVTVVLLADNQWLKNPV